MAKYGISLAFSVTFISQKILMSPVITDMNTDMKLLFDVPDMPSQSMMKNWEDMTQKENRLYEAGWLQQLQNISLTRSIRIRDMISGDLISFEWSKILQLFKNKDTNTVTSVSNVATSQYHNIDNKYTGKKHGSVEIIDHSQDNEKN